MNKCLELFNQNKNIQTVINEIDENTNILVKNTTENHNYLLASTLYENKNKTIVYVASNVYKASKCYDNLVKVLGYENVNLYVIDEVVASEVDATSIEFKSERINTIKSIINNDRKIIVTHVNAIARELIPLSKYKNSIIHLDKGMDIQNNSIIMSLTKLGYRKTPTTTVVGDFSVRGSIIDIYPINFEKPIRIDLFDTEIESIKSFDTQSQRSIKGKTLNSVDIYPNIEIIYNDERKVIESIRKDEEITGYKLESDINDIENYNISDKFHKYLHYFVEETQMFLDYIDDKIVLFDDINELKECYDKTINELYYYLETQEKNNLNLVYFTDFYYIFNNEKNIFLERYGNKLNLELNINKEIDINGCIINHYQNDIKVLCEDVKINKNNKYYISLSSEENKKVFDETIKYNHSDLLNRFNVFVEEKSISFGFFDGIMLIDESSIYKKMNLKTTRYRSTYQNTEVINSKDDIKAGDYVVHYDYGIGQYNGIKVIELNGIVNDYLSIKYANMEVYIPIEKINLLEKYQAEEGSAPKLTTIGNGEWEKKKKKIKDKIENIARDLVLLQALRETKPGYKYDVDDEIIQDFENDFEYQETKDQLETINVIKQDMEAGKIVDRLVCGDVGYGKTEVAIRIAMKTILNGKQVAYLAPTTILTRQHYYTFKERMEKYGVKVAMLNRLVSVSKQNKIIEDLKSGKIDCVIGTHALLNDKVGYKDLGLLIIDEEQRFGVTHKEKIKQYKNNVNVLTLTATPIPRTLQMSIMGARQMSLIETPPQNRYPIQTYVLEKNDAVIREAIYNELSRNGQVFYLHNRVRDLERVYKNLVKQVPEARIRMAHGQMDRNELEDAIQDFIDHKYDVLLCTTIIETGIDIPNTNTLIIDMADKLGLAQMYQIRGRVGRSDKVSFAYFMYDHEILLTKEGEARLEAIKEFTSLGSGYKIAVRDLVIRGAGDFLGKEQSGYIDTVGLDLYMKLLSQSINEVKGIKEDVPIDENAIVIQVSKHVSDDYVSDEEIKIYIHKQITSIKNKEDKERVIQELTDRFGSLNEDLMLYIEKQYLTSLCEEYGIDSITENDFKVNATFTKDASLKIEGVKLMKIVFEMGEDYSVIYKNKRFSILINKVLKQKTWITNLSFILEELFCHKS